MKKCTLTKLYAIFIWYINGSNRGDGSGKNNFALDIKEIFEKINEIDEKVKIEMREAEIRSIKSIKAVSCFVCWI